MERMRSNPEFNCTLEKNNCVISNLLSNIENNVDLMQTTGRIIETISSMLISSLADRVEGKREGLNDYQKECLLQNLRILGINLDDKGYQVSERLRTNI